ncbi:bifunctional adenosylcobinamide kinase/adenosylcobinamide-phosphate guanylyltransferase [Halobacillus naozhouensis]|uniref:Adenosylcobinamide kinase n=1 Tax=Halobacillus naozhouensis TaxID=554880 RepID=A0ABY8IZD3_9BACI|nr:bifunctional adenosylcobinamide kinase/adenosylcobinamide-phosphate guanylyltransferase [Halobacillus naozhouensis]WFT74742.1 bifunctional adenosylcobinamide kinase/adenosylcobinamide-phosphate guanylyltransferase [Halobacillus naozhouensis]
MMTFVCGGVRSGKTSYAEGWMLQSNLSHLHYVATGVVTDSEMQERVFRHQKDRKQSRRSWQTWEQPTTIDQLSFTEDDAVLLDCLTTWVTNEMMVPQGKRPDDLIDFLIEQLDRLIADTGELYIISNDLTRDLPSSSELVQDYLYILGTIHKYVIRQADQAIEMVFGQPIFHKGEKYERNNDSRNSF